MRALLPAGAADEPPYVPYHLQTWDGELFSVVRSGGGDVLNADRTKLVLDEAAGVAALEQWVELAARSKVATPALPLPQGGFNSGRVGVRFGVGSQVPGIREAIKRGEPQHVAWAYERPNGGRGFGFTGGHVHWNWGHDEFRQLVVNAIVWSAGLDVPADGVPVRTLTVADLEANQDEPPPADHNPARIQAMLDEWNR